MSNDELTDEEYEESIKREAEIKQREIVERLARKAVRDALPQELKDWRQKKENDIKIERRKITDEMDRLNDRLAELESLSSDYRRGDMDEEFYKVPEPVGKKVKKVKKIRKAMKDFLQEGDFIRRSAQHDIFAEWDEESSSLVDIYTRDGRMEILYFDTLNALSVFHTKVVLGRKYEPNAWLTYEVIRGGNIVDNQKKIF